MAICVVRLTQRKRYLTAIIVVALLISQSLIGIAITTWSIYICVALSPSLYSERSEVSFVFTVTGMYGTHILFHNLSGLKICRKCYKQTYKKSTRGLLFFWTIAGCNTLINILIISMMATKISKHIVRSLRHSIEKGMHHYLNDPHWKHTIDRLQVKLRCCGVESYKDWHETAWLDEHRINLDSDFVKSLRTSKSEMHLPVTPWSCCDVTFPMQCFHDPLQQPESTYLWTEQPEVVLDSIYPEGCLRTLRKPIEKALIGFILLTLLILVLQDTLSKGEAHNVELPIITFSLLRILYTSCRNALILDNPGGLAPGWIFGRGDCGWSRGPGLEELMEGYESEGSAPATTKSEKSSKQSWKVNFKLDKIPKMPQAFNKSKKSDEEPISSGDEAALML